MDRFRSNLTWLAAIAGTSALINVAAFAALALRAKMVADKRLLAALEHNLGPVLMGALRDPEVVEIMLNPDGRIWIERLGQDMESVAAMDPGQSRLIISLVASGLETVVTTENPIVEGELPLDGSRFEGLLPPVVSSPSFTIRKKASRVFAWKLCLSRHPGAGIDPGDPQGNC